jgi:GDPmannose 4,6-dehydratase
LPKKSFRVVDIEIDWRGGVEERGIDASNGKTLIEADPRYFRPTEVDLLLGDPGRI